MSIKGFAILATLILCSCENLKVEGDYTYTKRYTEKRDKSIQLSYSNNIGNMPVILTGKANHDPIHTDWPGYQETSIEMWFW